MTKDPPISIEGAPQDLKKSCETSEEKIKVIGIFVCPSSKSNRISAYKET